MNEVQSFADRLGRLSIADRNSTQQPQVTLTAAINDVNQAISILSRLLADDKDAINKGDAVEICSLRTKANELASIAHVFNDRAERSIIAQVISMGGLQKPDISKLLWHFDRHILAIAKRIVGESEDDANILWRIAEECYNEAINCSGKLDPDDYFNALEETYLELPYDRDFESAEYYEHENRLNVHEEYAEVRRRSTDLSEQLNGIRKTRVRKSWIRFWARALSRCPGGPTLFHPPARLIATPAEWSVKDIPRYLFRAFDSNSAGTSNCNVVASVMSMDPTSNGSRDDIFSLKDQDASDMLHRHLVKGCFWSSGSDNLMSWSSSLMFVIQYAIWRKCNSKPEVPKDVWICAVDTRKFPQGQFAKDKWLLHAYGNTKLDDQQKKFRELRLDMPQWDNGEYLSQGTLNHSGRSCVLSLRGLIGAGLCTLYPEFDFNHPDADVQARTQWPKRVLQLRQRWAYENSTTSEEVECAFKIANNCFGLFADSDIALLLLGFKNRKVLGTSLCQYKMYRIRSLLRNLWRFVDIFNWQELWHESSEVQVALGREE
ncbi:hypothetical protein NW762_011733 [Fusarium torreyae]|uniref:DUF7587 domain-containing protein n=1 Tax=Fusarium torreyae TaxID=1237075 RepID=A0A9W8V973_9HYPO|nr:hypothetical protein NW762_011733 [Fusarium torreyae]